MLNKILRIIVGLPFVTIWWTLICILVVAVFCPFVVASWVGKRERPAGIADEVAEMSKSPYQFVKDVWND